MKIHGRLLQGCRFELGYLRSYVQQTLERLKTGSPLGDVLLSVALPATGGALVNPLVFEHAPRPLITVLNAVSAYTQTSAKALKSFASVQSTLPRGPQWDAFQQGVVLRTTLTEAVTRLECMIRVAVESLDKEIQHLGLAAQPDPADHAMGQRISKILTGPIEEPNHDDPQVNPRTG